MNRLLRTIGGCGLAVVIIIALVMGLIVSIPPMILRSQTPPRP